MKKSSMRRSYTYLLLASALCASQPVIAQNAGNSASSTSVSAAEWDRARTVQSQSHDMAAHQAVDRWRLLSNNDRMGFGAYSSFLTTYPGYPQEMKLRGYAEKALQTESPDTTTLVAFFDRFPPISNTAAGRYASALSNLRRTDAAQRSVAAWRGGSLLQNDESLLLALYSDRLTSDDHDARMDALLWQAERTQAERQIAFVSATKRNAFMERLSLLQGAAPGSMGILIDPSLLRDPGYIYNRALQARTNRNLPASISLLSTRAPLSAPVHNPERWLKELLDRKSVV